MRNTFYIPFLIAAMIFSRSTLAEGPIVIKFSHVVAGDTPKGKGAIKFKELAEKYTNGKVKIEVYPNSTLYKDKEELEALQLGADNLMLAPSSSKFGPIGIKQFEILDLPYILPSAEIKKKVLDGPIGKQLLGLLQPKGMVGLAYWDNGFADMTANKPLRKPEDYKGLKFRIQSSKVTEAMFHTYGATPQVMAFSDVYQALQTGVVDGQGNTPSNVYTQKMHEVQKFMTLTNNFYISYVVVVNKKFWDGLPADIRTQLSKAMDESTVYTNDIAQQQNDEALELIKKSGKTQIIALSDAEQAVMKKSVQPIYDEMAPRLGKEMLADFLKATGK